MQAGSLGVQANPSPDKNPQRAQRGGYCEKGKQPIVSWLDFYRHWFRFQNGFSAFAFLRDLQDVFFPRFQAKLSCLRPVDSGRKLRRHGCALNGSERTALHCLHFKTRPAKAAGFRVGNLPDEKRIRVMENLPIRGLQTTEQRDLAAKCRGGRWLSPVEPKARTPAQRVLASVPSHTMRGEPLNHRPFARRQKNSWNRRSWRENC
jgi:hypothetical protein